jgi:hypothetical protein
MESYGSVELRGLLMFHVINQFSYDDSGAFHTSDWKLYRNTITKLMCDKFGATKAHTSKGSILTFDSDKLERI